MVDTPFHILIGKVFNAQKNKARPRIVELGLSMGQPKILNYLAYNDGCMQRDLAEYCNIEAATVSRLLVSMEKSDLIRRRTDHGNRRAVQVRLTKHGKEACREIRRYFKIVDNISLDGFSDDEKQQFRDYLLRMHANLTEEKRP